MRGAIFMTMAAAAAAALAFGPGRAALAEDAPAGQLNPEEGGLDQLAQNIALHPDHVGTLCWIAYEVQKGGSQHQDQAAAAMQQCANSGNPPSMILLAHAYENGLGVPKDARMSTHWVRQAALRGYSLGEYHYGMALLAGFGTEPDRGLARHWLSLAAEHGSADAIKALRQMGDS